MGNLILFTAILLFIVFMIVDGYKLSKERKLQLEKQADLTTRTLDYINSLESVNEKSSIYIESLKDVIQKQKQLIHNQNNVILKYKEFCLINFEKSFEKES